jgi:hypothetical protein
MCVWRGGGGLVEYGLLVSELSYSTKYLTDLVECQMFVTPVRYKYRKRQNLPRTAILNSIHLQYTQLSHWEKHIFTWFPLFALGGQSFVRQHDVTIACPRS